MIEDNNPKSKSETRWKVIGINLGILFIYTLLCRFIDGGIILDAFFIAIHFVVGVIAAIIVKKWEWALSAFLVLAIGFSTCVSFLSMGNMH